MTTPPDDHGGLTRRQLIATAGATATGVAVLTAVLPTGPAGAAPAAAPTTSPLAFDPPVPGLTYVMIDAASFHPLVNANYRYVDDLTGAGGNPPPNIRFAAPLTLPQGAVIKQVNITSQGTPTFRLRRRPLAGTTSVDVLTEALGPGLASETITVDETVAGDATYSLEIVLGAPGDSVVGMAVGYVPPPSAFVPFTGPDPRALDTRSGLPLGPGAELTVDLAPYGALGRAVVANLTADQPGGTGYLSMYSADLAAWPGNSSLNYSPAIPNIANGVICTLGAGNGVKIRAGEAATHVILDVIGYLL